MSDNYATVSQLVTEGRNLLDAIKGGAIGTMQSQFDGLTQSFNTAMADFKRASDAKIAQQEQALNAAIAPAVGKFTTLALTPNQVMNVKAGSTIPTGFAVRTGMTLTKVININHNPFSRSEAEKQFLTEMETGIQKDYPDFDIQKNKWYGASFNVFRVSWNFPEDTDMNGFHWTLFPGRVQVGAQMSVAAFVKLEEGVANGAFMTNYALGEWRFSKYTASSSFGEYLHAHPIARTPKGSFLIALPVIATGNIHHPHHLFTLPQV